MYRKIFAQMEYRGGRKATLLGGLMATAVAQIPSDGEGGGESGGSGNYSDNGHKVQFAAILVPSYSPSFGWGIGALVTGFYKIDRGGILSRD